MTNSFSVKCDGHCATCRRSGTCPARRVSADAPILQDGVATQDSSRDDSGVGFAVDIGSTTLAAALYDLRTGTLLAKAGALNPQMNVSTDVIGRISAAETPDGLSHLQAILLNAIEELVRRVCDEADVPPDSPVDGVVTGNPVMLHIATGRSPSPLGRSPFRASWLAGCRETLAGRSVWTAPCIGAFVGADLVCALIAAGMDTDGPPALLCDIGTNAEVAVRAKGTIFTASTAAGPAFENCGVRGSVLLDAIATFIENGMISETGASVPGSLVLDDGRMLTNADVRAVQTAKAAIAAGIATVLEESETDVSELSEIFLAGGFGCGLNIDSAVKIGMLPRTPGAGKTMLGNAALSGAATLLLHPERRESAKALARTARLVDLGGNPKFSDRFIEAMMFRPN